MARTRQPAKPNISKPTGPLKAGQNSKRKASLGNERFNAGSSLKKMKTHSAKSDEDDEQMQAETGKQVGRSQRKTSDYPALKPKLWGGPNPRAATVMPSERIYGQPRGNAAEQTAANAAPSAKVQPITSLSGLLTRNGEMPPRYSTRYMQYSMGDRNGSNRAGQGQGSSTQAKEKTDGKYNGLDPNNPPLSNIDDIFDHILQKAVGEGFLSAISRFKNVPLRVLTMCSGTEAPILSLQLLQKAVDRAGYPSFQFEHLASAEIEPFKQAYIQRNFNPPIIFRDVREFDRKKCPGNPSTVYNGTAARPPSAHILIAGSSCVDYSTLNKKIKKFGVKGESFATMKGICCYAQEFRPNVVILENVKTAPWKAIEDYWNKIGYHTQVVLIDTKNYYLPQTRQRGYVVAFDKTRASTISFELAAAAKAWAGFMNTFQHRATSPFTDFIFTEDDPYLELLRNGSTITQGTANIKAQDWTACRHRYSHFRMIKLLGTLRPLTHWQNNGSCKFPDFGWQSWGLAQRERIWDTLDINHLAYVAERDYDMNFKHREIELSQNVDRDSDSRPWGIVGCLTPSGMPYLTSRGGPLTGREVLALQGIPVMELNLTRETTRQLQDLGGNAMTTTVAAAAMISAILVATSADFVPSVRRSGSAQSLFEEFDLDAFDASGHETLSIATKPVPLSVILEHGMAWSLEHRMINLGSSQCFSVDDFLDMAHCTMQWCKCEGVLRLNEGSFQQCRECGHRTCQSCGRNPPHEYQELPQDSSNHRLEPNRFVQMLDIGLPRLLDISGFALDLPARQQQSLIDDDDLSTYQGAKRNALQSRVFFEQVKRGTNWRVLYTGLHARLELHFVREPRSSRERFGGKVISDCVRCYWLLFAKPPRNMNAGSDVRRQLNHPIARMTPETSILDGPWELWSPDGTLFPVRVSGIGKLKKSWEQNLGLRDGVYLNHELYPRLVVQSGQTFQAAERLAAEKISGEYELLPKCGTACGKLHRKVQMTPESGEEVYMFLDPHPLEEGRFDRMVFAHNHSRLSNGEYRQVIARFEDDWRPERLDSETKCKLIETWIPSEQARIFCPEATKLVRAWFPTKLDKLDVGHKECGTSTITAFVANFPLSQSQQQSLLCEKRFHLALQDRPGALQDLQWLVKRVANTARVQDWQRLDIGRGHFVRCNRCAPCLPESVWAHVRKYASRYYTLKPFEEGEQATNFEEEMKKRPLTVEANLHCYGRKKPDVAAEPTFDTVTMASTMSATVTLEVKLNLVTAAHQLLARLVASGSQPNNRLTVQWRLTADAVGDTPAFPKLRLLSNSDGPVWEPKKPSFANAVNPTSPRNFVRELFPAQSRAMAWMLRQELSPPPWVEREREEINMPALNLRLEIKAELTKGVRGGILADEVGAGKTITSLALIAASAAETNKVRPQPFRKRDATYASQATLILVPKNILNQWENEAAMCFSSQISVVKVQNLTDLAEIHIGRLTHADVVLAPWDLFDDAGYWEILADLCAAENAPLAAGRAFAQWLSTASSDLSHIIGKSDGWEDHASFWNARADKKAENSHKYDTFKKAAVRMRAPEPDVILDTKSGASGKDAEELASLDTTEPKLQATADRDVQEGGNGCASVQGDTPDADVASSPARKPPMLPKRIPASATKRRIPALLHLFSFKRLIVDEFTYLRGKSLLAILNISASAKWMLSGTPPLVDFDSVNTMAKLIGTKVAADDERDGCFALVKNQKDGGMVNNDKTFAEEFEAYRTYRSFHWITRRNEHAAEFVRLYVRQNPADLSKIEREDHIIVVKPSVIEQAIYFEAYQIVMSRNLKFDTKPRGLLLLMTRKDRLHAAITRSHNREEALMACVSEMRAWYLGKDPKPKARQDHTEPQTVGNSRSKGSRVMRILKPKSAAQTAKEEASRRANERGMKELEDSGLSTRRHNFVSAQDMCLSIIEDKEKDFRAVSEQLTFELREAFGFRAERPEETAEDNPHLSVFINSIVNHHMGDVCTTSSLDHLLCYAADNPITPTGPFKASRQSKAMAGHDDDDQQDPDEGKSGLKLAAEGKLLATRKKEMSERAASLNLLVMQLVEHVRELRLFHAILGIVKRGQAEPCDAHQEVIGDLRGAYILGLCGHVICKACITVRDDENDSDGCLSPGCGSAASSQHLIPASSFAEGHTSPASESGSKMTAIIDQIRYIVDHDRFAQGCGDERCKSNKKNKRRRIQEAEGLGECGCRDKDCILVFVQHDQVAKHLFDCLRSEIPEIEYVNATTAATSRTGVARFISGDQYRICVLRIDSPDAAGWNLHKANHVMFVSPFVTQHEYDYASIMTQAIGRAKRFRQTKKVHVYHFLMARTIDVNILQERQKKTLVKRGEKFEMVDGADVRATDERGWGGPSLTSSSGPLGSMDSFGDEEGDDDEQEE